MLEDRVRDADLVAPPVVLPDFLHKDDMEMPSSITVATRDTIRSTFTSSSVNCGMALIALDIERPRVEAIGDFYRRVRERYPWPPRRRLELSTNDVLRCAKEGAAFAVDRFALDARELERIEEGGCLDVDRYGGAERVGRELPWMTRQLARMRFGTIGPSNHFIELQQVEEVIDAPVAAKLGVHVGQLTLQYHGGGGVLAFEIWQLVTYMFLQDLAHRPLADGGPEAHAPFRLSALARRAEAPEGAVLRVGGPDSAERARR